MVRMCYALVLALAAPASAFRVDTATQDVVEKAPSCACSDSGVVDGVETKKLGCAIHFGQRFGYVCYMDQGSACPTARKSKRLGVFWRSCRNEHLAETAKGFLVQAMEGMDLEALERTLSIAEMKGVDQPTLDAATARVAVVIQMIAAQQELVAAVKAFDVARLQSALEETERLELDEFISDETLEAAAERLEYLDKGIDAEAALRVALEGTDVDELRACIADVARFHSARYLVDEGRDRLQVVIAQIAAAEAALTAVMNGLDPEALEDAIVEAETLPLSPELMSSASDRVDALYASQAAEEDLLQAIQGEDKKTLDEVLVTAQNVGIGIEAAIRDGQSRSAELQAMIDEAAAQLVKLSLGTNFDAEALRSAIKRAMELDKVKLNHLISVANGRLRVLDEKERVKKDLKRAADGPSMRHLQELLVKAHEVGLTASEIQAGEDGINRLRLRMHNAEVNMVRLGNSGTNANDIQAAIDEVKLLNAASQQAIQRAEDRVAHLRR